MFWFWIWRSKKCRLHDVSHQKSLSDRRFLIKIPQFFIQQKCFHIFYGRMLAKTLFFRTEQRRLVLIFFSTDSDHDCDENIAFNCYPQGARQSPRKGTCIHVVNKHNLCIRLRLSLTAMVTTATSIHLNKHGKFLIQERSQLSATKAIFGV